MKQMGLRSVMLARIRDSILRKILRRLDFDEAMYFSKYLMLRQGFGSGGAAQKGGEAGILKLISRRDPVVFDVGAHVGEYAAMVLENLPSATVYAFEPSDAHFARLQNALSGDSRAKLFNVGLAEKVGRRNLFKASEVSGLASFAQRRLDHFDIKMDLVEDVTVTTVDEVVAEIGIAKIDLLKIDVEGFEIDVLKGSVNSLASGIIDFVQFEFGGTYLDTHTNFQDMFYLFERYGMVLGIIKPDGSVHVIDRYREIYEYYNGASNWIAGNRDRLSALA
ncbi:FkbM family methyltransferase [Pleomorphomonas sp. NRK KF1]|uniref:FkbM family methyltransferase n=1 Tax=Pleomorphomonas sp. NRK KF1 TaxID=2943000 RepID=UPI002043C50B|nr:FkbM family methyltransferase [Pleomorphomonas sp. NRK KF1]MCM5555140.1 FkbM family methyltransferase [Pleomorphomonas sp. NRK KF1]